MAMSPVSMNVIPKPFRGAGMFEYEIFSLMEAMAKMAKNQPTPEPNP